MEEEENMLDVLWNNWNAFSVATEVKCRLRAERLMLTVDLMNLQFF